MNVARQQLVNVPLYNMASLLYGFFISFIDLKILYIISSEYC